MAVSLSEISPRDLRTQAQMDALLEQEGIRRDRNLDYSCGVFDDGELIACGSSFHNTLRCLAVSSEHRGEGLMNQVVSHLMERQVNLGNSHVFLYTKLKNERIFKDLGFYEIARVDGSLVFLENRRDGFARYLRSLEKTKRDGKCAAVVMNANPFTLGHRYLVERAAKENGIPFRAVRLESREAAQNAPTPVTTYALFRDGAYLTNEQMNDTKFLKLALR